LKRAATETTTINGQEIILDASNQQRFKIAQMFQQFLKQDPMIKKIGGQASGLLLEAVRFQFEQLPLKAKQVVKKVAGDEETEKVYLVFRFKWNHPCIDYSTEILHEIPEEDFEAFV